MEKKKENKSILKEALSEYNEIMEAADANAKKKLAEEFPEKFKDMLKEEINNNKKKSVKESYKKIDETNESKKEVNLDDDTETKTESDMKEKKETNKVVNEETKDVIPKVKSKGKPFDEKAKGLEKIKEEKEKKNLEKDNEIEDENLTEERDKDFMGDLESDSPNQAKDDKMKKGVAYNKEVTPSSGKPISNKKEKNNLTESDSTEIDHTIDTASDDDEFITIDDIDKEIENLETDINEDEDNDVDPFKELVNIQKTLDKMIKKYSGNEKDVDEQKRHGGKQDYNGREDGGPTQSMIDEEDVDEQKRHGGKQDYKGREDGGPTQSMIDEESAEITDADIEAVLDDLGNDVDETLDHTITHSNSRQVGAQNNTNYGKANRLRYAMKENKDFLKSLIGENKKLTKKLNENKKQKISINTLVENYKSALEKYRNQLKEMAVFNTNLAHVNNLLVNEGLALTQEDKIKIINEFKSINTISNSQEKYKSFLNEMKNSKKTISENIEDKVNNSIQPSSKQKLDEVVEKTAYENNKHIDRMKELIEYHDKKKKKKII